MSASKKTVLVALALTGAMIGTAALAQSKGMWGEGRGGMLTEMFEAIDADSDGKITLAELEAHRKAEFAAADTNGDGALSPDELSAHQLARIQARLAERTQAMLDNMDNDGNGSLSEDEMGKGPGERHFARLDTDNDGAISKAEAEEAMQHRGKRGHGGGMGNN
ncbi:MAG: calcium-binding protein [Rhodobacter sp.]|nr:calcium-binding protein [Rhodobacter sp.]MBS3978689.1 calcium-binding protein [Paracoccaceae bacterium]